MQPPRIKIGLLLDGNKAPAWARRVLELLLAEGNSELCLAVMSAQQAQQSMPEQRLRRLLNRYYQTVIERGLYDKDPEAQVDIDDLLRGVPTVQATAQHDDAFASIHPDQVSPYQLDVFIHLSAHTPGGAFAYATPLGLWSLQFSASPVRNGVGGFWESMCNEPESGSALIMQKKPNEQERVLLCRGYAIPNWMSVRGNKSNYYWKTAGFVARQIRELRRMGREAFMQQARPIQCSAPDLTHPPDAPSNARYAGLLLKKTLQKLLLVRRNRATFDQWMLLYKLHQGASTTLALKEFTRITPPPDRFWADPHVIERDGNYYIFIEELLYAKGIGHLAYIKMAPNGEYTQPQTILERPYHLSYPFIFEFDGELYMIPETAQNSTIELYRCAGFPNQWVFVKNLMQGIKAWDSTLVFKNGKWWLFASMAEYPNIPSTDELFLFYADSPLSTVWTPHPLNPIISDCKQARPAGRIFERDGQLFRPSQNCSNKYGYGFNIARIDTLTETGYQETVVSRIKPEWAPDLVSTHTYANQGALQVIDAELRRSRR